MIDTIECSKCVGLGEVLIRTKEYVRIISCPKCKGKGSLDWIENIMGVKGTYIKPGIYTMEVDYSEYISKSGTFRDNNDPWRFELDYENNRE